jgi:CRP-like cAMP-binding protein
MPSVLHALNRLLQSVPAVEFEALRPHLEFVDLVREAVLIEAGAPLTHVYLPWSGAISMRARLSEGQTVDVAMVGCDSVFGASAAFGGRASLTDAVVLLPGKASILHVAHFQAAADRSAAFRALLAGHEQALFAQAQQSAACNASHSVEARLSRWLLRARFVQQRKPAADPGSAGANDRRAAQRGFRSSPMRCRRPGSFATAGGRSKSPTCKA